jgi:hypothetical protein
LINLAAFPIKFATTGTKLLSAAGEWITNGSGGAALGGASDFGPFADTRTGTENKSVDAISEAISRNAVELFSTDELDSVKTLGQATIASRESAKSGDFCIVFGS